MKTIERIEREATSLLRKLNLMTLPIPIKKIVRQLDVKLKSFDLGKDVSGVLVIEDGKSRIGYNSFEPEVRQRFSIAHELGHHILHNLKKEDKLFVDNINFMFRRKGSSNIEIKQEREANSFAAAILMPEEIVKFQFEKITSENEFLNDDKIIKELASKFKVSQAAMTYRLINLGYILNINS